MYAGVCAYTNTRHVYIHLQLVALLRKETCNSRHPMCVRHPMFIYKYKTCIHSYTYVCIFCMYVCIYIYIDSHMYTHKLLQNSNALSCVKPSTGVTHMYDNIHIKQTLNQPKKLPQNGPVGAHSNIRKQMNSRTVDAPPLVIRRLS